VGIKWSTPWVCFSRVCLLAVFVAALFLATRAEAQGWVHPQAAEQPTARGKTINTLARFQGDLYAGFGDARANTGPIAINPFDVASKTFEGPFFADTEEIETFRELDGRLFVPHTDTQAGADYSVRPSSGWSQHDAFASLHVFDAAETQGSLWLCGSNDVNGTVWRSTDGGATWQLSLSVPPWSGQAGDYVRIYFCAAVRGELHVQPHSRFAPTPASWVFSVGSWSQAPSLTGGGPGYHGEVFNEELVFQSSLDGDLLMLSGNYHAVSPEPLEDYAVAGDRLYALTQDKVLSTPDLETWKTIAHPPGSATSIAYADGSLYVGTDHATIAPVDFLPTEPGTPPTDDGSPQPDDGSPSNEFGFGKLKKNKRKGTAKLTVEVPGPGDLALTETAKVKGAEKEAEAAGDEKLAIKPKGKAKKKLNQKGTAKVEVEVTYTPELGASNTESKKVGLKKR
jgi:hypothetical protein